MNHFDTLHTHEDDELKQSAARRSALLSGAVNIVLASVQIVIGVFAHSQALIADGIHSLADLVADGVVLFASQHSHQGPDEDHQYGHRRYETIASLILGVLLLAVGAGMLWRAGDRLASGMAAQTVMASALFVAIITLVSKEALFRYMLREAQRVRSSMLVANAWHARSDAASSLVVALGIGGSLAGYPFLDALAAAVVGFLVARMGWRFSWAALNDLADAAVDSETIAAMHETLAATPGVVGVHLLRTRKMGDLALVDAHLIVSPRISVSEGHFIAEQARERLLAAHPVLDAVIHIDPEDDLHTRPSSQLPDRAMVLVELEKALGPARAAVRDIQLHYLDGRLQLDVFLTGPEAAKGEDEALRHGMQQLLKALPDIASFQLHRTLT